MEHQIIELTDSSIKKIAKEVHKLNKKEQERAREELRDNAYHNTRELLENYQKIKAHCDIVNEQLEEDKWTFWEDERLNLTALLTNKAKSVKYYKHINRGLEKYKEICRHQTRAGKARRYEILKGIYINSLTVDVLSAKYDVDRTTIAKGRDEGIQELSVILYGPDGIK